MLYLAINCNKKSRKVLIKLYDLFFLKKKNLEAFGSKRYMFTFPNIPHAGDS